MLSIEAATLEPANDRHLHHRNAGRAPYRCAARDPFKAGVLTMLARTPQDEPQHAAHVTDFYCATALAQLRAMGACSRNASRKLTECEFDHNQFSIENGDGEIY